MALVEFYIKNYKQNNAIVTTETLMQTIPMANPETALRDPKPKGEMGKAGSMDFGMEPDNPYYDAMLQMKTIIRVAYAGKTIFRGRVLTIDKGLWMSRSIHCEGSFAFLLDSHQEGTKEETRPTIGVLQYLQQLIAAHNADVEADKQFALGEVPGQYTNATAAEQRVVIPADKAQQQFGSTSWDTTMNRLEDLLDNFGGYFRVRYDAQSGISYLDWLDKYYENVPNTQSIEVAKNLIDISGTTEVDNLFTMVIPIGKSESDNIYISDYWPVASSGHSQVKYIMVPELATLGLCTDAELNSDYHRKEDYAGAIDRYGKIWKTVDFENANTPEKLFRYAVDWIRNNYMPEVTQWDVTALDLRTYDSTEQPLMIGDRVPLRHPEVTNPFGTFTVIAAEYDLYHMEKTKYTIGIPNQVINAAYGVKQKQEKSGKSGKGGGSSSKSKEPPPPTDTSDDLDRIKSVIQQQYSLKTDWKQDIPLDNPLAFLAHDEHGEKVSAVQFAKNLKPYTKDIIEAFNFYDNPLNLRVDAGKQGLDPDDPNTKAKLANMRMASRNKELAQKQQTWKANTANFFTSTLGLTEQETNVLLNESAGTSWLAGMVDDDGNWSQAAYSCGMHLRPNASDIKEQAVKTRNLLTKKEGVWPGTKILNGMQEFIVADKLNLDNFLSADGGLLQFNLGEMFNLDGVKNIFKLISNALNLDGSEDGSIKVGKFANKDWKIKINDPITYIDIDGNEQTVSGAISAQDFNIPTIPSFKTKLAVMDQLIADKATIGELRAYEALLGTFDRKPKRDADGKVVTDKDGNVVYDTDDQGNPLYEGTAFETGEKIAAVNGAFVYEKGTDGKQHLKVDSGGAYVLKTDSGEFGIWNKGELDAGFFAGKDANGTYTQVVGDKVYLGDLTETEKEYFLDDFAKDAVNKSGVFAKYLRAKTIKTDNLDVTDGAELAGLRVLGDSQLDGNLYLNLDGKHYIQGTNFKAVDEHGRPVEFTYGNFKDAIIKASVDSGTLRLWKYGADTTKTSGDGILSFSKATSLSEKWSGSTLTISGKPEQTPALKYTINVDGKSTGSPDLILDVQVNGAGESLELSKTLLKVPYKIVEVIPGSGDDDTTDIRREDAITVDASVVFDAVSAPAITFDAMSTELDNSIEIKATVDKKTTDVDTNSRVTTKKLTLALPSNKYDKRTIGNNEIYCAEVKDGTTVVGRASVDRLYDWGWNAAYDSVYGQTYTVSGKRYNYNPSSGIAEADRLSYIKAAIPSSTVDGALGDLTYYLTNNGDKAQIRVGSDSGDIVAELTHGAASANRNSQISGFITSTETPAQTLSANTTYKFQSQYQNADGTWADGGAYVIKTAAGTPTGNKNKASIAVEANVSEPSESWPPDQKITAPSANSWYKFTPRYYNSSDTPVPDNDKACYIKIPEDRLIEGYNSGAKNASWIDYFASESDAKAAKTEDGKALPYGDVLAAGGILGLYYNKADGKKYYKAYWKVPVPTITVDGWNRTKFEEDKQARTSKSFKIPISVNVNGVTYSNTFDTPEIRLEQYASTQYANVVCGNTIIARLYFDMD